MFTSKKPVFQIIVNYRTLKVLLKEFAVRFILTISQFRIKISFHPFTLQSRLSTMTAVLTLKLNPSRRSWASRINLYFSCFL